jgi:hypothetical protein
MSQNISQFSWLVYTLSENEKVDRAMVRKICRWLRESCNFFYLSGHGRVMPEQVTDHRVKIGANVKVCNLGGAVGDWTTVTVPYWVGARQYRIVFLDTCHSGGSNKSGNPADPWGSNMTRYPHVAWADAFNIDYNEIYEGAFLGYNGESIWFSTSGPGQSYRDWTDHFWQALVEGLSTREAVVRANQRLPSNAPQPNPRSVWTQYNRPKLVSAGEYKW